MRKRILAGIPVILTQGEDGYIVAECPSLPGCVSQGIDEDDALRNIEEAAEGWLQVEATKSRDSRYHP